jgi:hypothetical protein
VVEENKRTDFLWSKSGLLAGGITVVGYLLGFSYESGYASYYGIPIQLIKLNLINIFISIFSLVALLFTLLLIINLGYMIFKERPGIIQRLLLSSAYSILCSAAVLFTSIDTSVWHIARWIILWPLLSLSKNFIWPLITHHNKGTYYQKLAAFEQLEQQESLKTIWSFINSRKNLSIIYNLLFIIWLLHIFIYRIGYAEAERTDSFFVAKGPKPLVVLRIYGDKFICAPFDWKKKTVERKFYILDAQQQNDFCISWEYIGRLKSVADNSFIDEYINAMIKSHQTTPTKLSEGAPAPTSSTTPTPTTEPNKLRN